MQINNVLSGQQDALARGKRFDPAQTLLAGTAQSLTPAPAATGSGQAVNQIMADYDVHNISPQKFSEMVQRLHDAGAISDKESRDLSLLRVDLDKAGIPPQQSLDLTAFCSGKIQSAQQQLQANQASATPNPAVQQGLLHSSASMQRRLDWLQKLAVVHSTPGTLGLDATA
jgi:hypothetical protein